MFPCRNCMNKKNFLEYFITFILSIVIAVLLVAVTVFTIGHRAKVNYNNQPKAQTVRNEREVLIEMIARYEKQLREDPSDYTLNSKLGNFYNILGHYESSEKHFKDAMAKSPYGIHSTYFDLAYFYLKQKRFKDAENVIKQITVVKKMPVHAAKGDFYVVMGDMYADFGDFEVAMVNYEKARALYEFSGRKKREKLAESRILDTYDDLAVKNMEKKKLTAAIQSLEKAREIKDSPVTNYKLAILYKDIDPLKSYKYIKKVYNSDPGLINYDIYEKILLDALKYYENEGDKTSVALYAHKLKMLKNFKERYLVQPGEIDIELKKTRVKNHIFNDKKTVYIEFVIKNLSHNNIQPLYLTVEADYNSSSEIIYTKKLFSKKSPLRALGESEPIKLKYTFDDEISGDFSYNTRLIFRAAKKQNIRPKQIASFTIKK